MEAVRLIRNAHHILGLPSGVDIQEIRKRSNHLLNLARIEESEIYETDLVQMSELRTEQNIRKAVEQLSGVKTRLIEAFFWFETPTLQDFSSLKELSKNNYASAISYWKNLSSHSPNWIAKKNEALANFIAAHQMGDDELFTRSLVLWREIEVSDQFWSFYQEHYKLTDDLGTDKSSFVELRTRLFEYLSWLTLDLYRKNPKPIFISSFFKQTGVVGQGIENHILAPVISKVKSELDAMDAKSDDAIRLRTKKVAVETALQELSRFDINDYSPVKALRENCASKFRSFSISAYNDKNDIALSKEFLNSAVGMSSSDSFLLQAERDKTQLDNNHAFDSFLEKVASESEGRTSREKWNIFLREEESLPAHLKEEEGFLHLKGRVFLGVCLEEFKASQDKLDADRMGKVFQQIWDQIHLFNLNKDKVKEMAKELEKRAKVNSSADQFQKIDEDDRSVADIADKSELDDDSKAAFLILCRSAIWKETIPYLHYKKFTKNISSVAWIVGIIAWANSTWYLGIGAWVLCIWAASYLGKKIYLK